MVEDRNVYLQIAQEIGTPVYVYDVDTINAQIEKLYEVFKKLPFKIHYAMKANEHPEILKIIKDKNLGVDAVSINEIKRALTIGFDKNKIIYTPSFPNFDDLNFAFLQGIQTHICAVEYFDFILKNFPDIPFGIRINPGNSISGNQKIATAHEASKFGIPINQLDLIKTYIDKGLKINSLHLHTGSDVKLWQDITRSVDIIFDFAKHCPNLKYLDLGSGFKVKYHPDDVDLDLKAYANYIAEKLKTYPKHLEIKFEPGKFLISDAGVFLVKVNMVKQGFDKQFVGVNSGFHHLIRPMYYNAYHQIVNLSNDAPDTKKYDIVGVLCEEDTFAYDRLLAPVKQDDILMIKNAGAYGASMVSKYNLRDEPKEVMIENGSFREI